MNDFYVARDANGYIYLYTEKPVKGSYTWNTENNRNACYKSIRIDCHLFPEVKWEDGYPTKVELIKAE